MHGLSIPLGKLGFYLPRTLSRGVTDSDLTTAPFVLGARVSSLFGGHPASRSDTEGASGTDPSPSILPRPTHKTGGSIIPKRAETTVHATSGTQTPTGVGGQRDASNANSDIDAEVGIQGLDTAPGVPARTIRFPDEEGPQNTA